MDDKTKELVIVGAVGLLAGVALHHMLTKRQLAQLARRREEALPPQLEQNPTRETPALPEPKTTPTSTTNTRTGEGDTTINYIETDDPSAVVGVYLLSEEDAARSVPMVRGIRLQQTDRPQWTAKVPSGAYRLFVEARGIPAINAPIMLEGREVMVTRELAMEAGRAAGTTRA